MEETNEWLGKLDAETRARADRMIALLQALEADDAEAAVRSEIEEGIAQVARFVFLRPLWNDIDRWRDHAATYVPSFIKKAQLDPAGTLPTPGWRCSE